MATEAHKFQVGIFVIAAAIIGIGALIWLGASRFFEKSDKFVTYFAESIQGLDRGAAVKYRGVPSGRVADIGIAPDGELIEVKMEIDPAIAKTLAGDTSLRTTLELSGITGLRFIEIDRRTGSALEQAPPLSFQPPNPVIPSARSSFKAVQDALREMYERVMQVDLPGISSDVRNALQAAQHVLQDERVEATLTNLRATTESTTQLAKNLEKMTSGVQLAPAVDNATQATAEARRLFTELSRGPTGQQLTQAITQLNVLVQSSQQAIVAMQYTLQRLDRAAVNLQGLTGELRAQPSRLLFSQPPEQRSAPEAPSP